LTNFLRHGKSFMDKFVISGGTPLHGTVEISGRQEFRASA